MNYHFQCIDCDAEYEASKVEYVCPSCAKEQKPMESTRGVLKVVLPLCKGELEGVELSTSPNPSLQRRGIIRYINFLPISDPKFLPPLQVGPTPLYQSARLSAELGLKNLYIKDDTGLPSASFKDRASAFVVAKARELKKDTIVTASTGNAATALACMCASVGMKCVIFVPTKAPIAKLAQILIYGAKLIPVDGTYDDAFDLSLAATREFGWYNRNTAYNPFTTEGKKTAALEIWEQLGGKAPDKIFIPTGDGVILAGIYKGFWDLKQIGLVEKLPQLIAVQAEGSAVVARVLNSNFELRTSNFEPAKTIADSICVSAPRNLNWAVRAIKETGGTAVTVSDDEIIAAISHLGRTTGIFAEPAAAASLAGLLKSLRGAQCATKQSPEQRGLPRPFGARNDIQDEVIVLLITGSGLKDVPAAQKAITLPKPIPPTIEAVKKLAKI